jgi:putative chitinase
MPLDRETQVLTDATAAGITDPRELANFMAQVTHESNGLNRLEESFRYTRAISQIPVQAAWREGPETLDAARKQALMGKPEQLAELMYGGRNGNDEPGDGWKYHGRGYVPLNGKDNYRAAGEALGLDLVKQPELAADPRNASKIAVWYWENRVPENAKDDVRAATNAINGRYSGLEDRENRFEDWQRRLTPEVMQRLAGGDVGRPQPGHAPDATQRGTQAHRLDHPAHPDHALFEQARTAVHALDAKHGRTPDRQSDQLSGAVTVEARNQGLIRIDHVVLSDDGSRAYAVQGDLNSPLKRMAEVDTAKAVNTPIEHSSAEIAKLTQTQPAPNGQTRQPAQEAETPSPAPAMKPKE